MNRRIAALLALALVVSACHAREAAEAGPRADHRMTLGAVGDTVSYFEQTQARSGIVNMAGDTVVTSSNEDEVFVVTRTAPDTLVASYEYIRIRVVSAGRVMPVVLDVIRNRPFVLAEIDGRYRVVEQPQVEGMQVSVADLAGQIDVLFRMPVPAQPLVPGLVWVDTVRTTENHDRLELERVDVSRFEVAGDTVLHGIPATLVRYRSAIETTMTDVITATDQAATTLNGEIEGNVVYAPGRRLVLAHVRSGRLEGEVANNSGDSTQRMPHFYEFDTTIDLLPPPDRNAPPPAEPETPLPN